jgi:hypothetical protein
MAAFLLLPPPKSNARPCCRLRKRSPVTGARRRGRAAAAASPRVSWWLSLDGAPALPPTGAVKLHGPPLGLNIHGAARGGVEVSRWEAPNMGPGHDAGRAAARPSALQKYHHHEQPRVSGRRRRCGRSRRI